MIAKIYIKFGGLLSSERMVYIQQVFVGNKPTGLSVYLEQAPLGAVVDAVMNYTDLPLGVSDLFLQVLYLNLEQL